MANDMYTKLFKQVNKLFKEDYLLKDNVPIDILTWIYNHYNIKIEGKVLIIDVIPDNNIIIIKDKNVDKDYIGMDIILSDNKPCKIIAISTEFLQEDFKFVQLLIFNIYKFILDDILDRYNKYNNSFSKVFNIAPYILTINTMQSFALPFSYDLFDIDEDMYKLLIDSCDYGVKELLDDGLILRYINKME